MTSLKCRFPIDAFKVVDNSTGQIKVVFKNIANNGAYSHIEDLKIRCGNCIACRLAKSRTWALRLMYECSQTPKASFLTLTYDPEHLPKDGSLVKDEIPRFMKNLRRQIEYHYGIKEGIRFFYCGEYGEKFGRPHYHIVLFGFDFPDRQPISTRNYGRTSALLYTSEFLRGVWKMGHVAIGSVTFESCSYVARYVLKKVTGDKASEHYQGRLPEFTGMSRRPGIGRAFYEKYKEFIYRNDECLTRLSKTGQIIKLKPPKYYDELYDLDNHEKMFDIKQKRKQFIAESACNSSYVDLKSSLTAIEREKHARGRYLGTMIRSYESLPFDSD